MYLVLNLDLVSQTGQRIPTRIRRCLFAGADCEVLVLTTTRAEALTVRFAEGSSGQGQQHLLAHDVLEQKTALFIIPDFSLICGNCVFAHLAIGFGRAEDEVELASDGLGDWFNAASTEDLEVAVVGGAQANVVDLGASAALFAAVFDKEIGLSLDGQWGDLADVGAVVQRAGSDGLVDLEGFVEELGRGNDHALSVGLWWGGVKCVGLCGGMGVCGLGEWFGLGGRDTGIPRCAQNDDN